MENRAAKILATIGFFIIYGAAGKADMMDSIGGVYPMYKIVISALLGLCFIIPLITLYLKEKNQ